jgi:hypothetical protein
MDLNLKYSDFQKAMIRAAQSPDVRRRDQHIANASSIANQIETYQVRLGAAASCAWSVMSLERLAKQALLAKTVSQ